MPSLLVNLQQDEGFANIFYFIW